MFHSRNALSNSAAYRTYRERATVNLDIADMLGELVALRGFTAITVHSEREADRGARHSAFCLSNSDYAMSKLLRTGIAQYAMAKPFDLDELLRLLPACASRRRCP
jgi:hypothetical protein